MEMGYPNFRTVISSRLCLAMVVEIIVFVVNAQVQIKARRQILLTENTDAI